VQTHVVPDVTAAPGLTELLKQLIQIGIALSSERDLPVLLERIVTEARRFTNAEAGTLYLRDGGTLRFAVVHNEPLAARLGADEVRARVGAEPLPLDMPSLAGHVAKTAACVRLADAYAVPDGEAYVFNPSVDARTAYRTRSVLVVPLQEPSGDVVGVLQLINARDAQGRVVAFEPEFDGLVRSLAAQAAVAIRNATLEDLSFKDPLTGAYNRRYFALRLDEEARRHTRFGEPVSLVLIDMDDFKPINDRHGHGAGDTVLREMTQVLVENSRDFSVVTRYGGDEFAVLLVNTPRAGALRYAERIRGVVAHHRFAHGHLTVSMGVATLPDDVRVAEELVPAADRALYAAKQAGRNTVR
jgi:diguanylate cyclase (GGDEF)-like protein